MTHRVAILDEPRVLVDLWNFNKASSEYKITTSHLQLSKQNLRASSYCTFYWKVFLMQKEGNDFPSNIYDQGTLYTLSYVAHVSPNNLFENDVIDGQWKKDKTILVPFFNPFLFRMNLDCAHLKQWNKSDWYSFFFQNFHCSGKNKTHMYAQVMK